MSATRQSVQKQLDTVYTTQKLHLSIYSKKLLHASRRYFSSVRAEQIYLKKSQERFN